MKRTRERRPHLTKEKANMARQEYCSNPLTTIEYLAEKYEVSRPSMGLVLANKTHCDPSYVNPRKKGGPKKAVFIPDHIKELKDTFTPAPTTLHRARGHNRTINKFS